MSDLSISTVPVASAPNRPPQVTFVNPLRDTTVLAGSGFYLQAEASDLDGTVDRVEFYSNNRLLSTCTSGAPYAYSWPNVPEGTSEVTVVAIDDQGAVSVGKVIKIKTVDRVSVIR